LITDYVIHSTYPHAGHSCLIETRLTAVCQCIPYHRGHLCLSRQLLRYTALAWAAHPYCSAGPWLTQLSTLHETVK